MKPETNQKLTMLLKILILFGLISFTHGRNGGAFVIPPKGIINVFRSNGENGAKLQVVTQGSAFKMGFTLHHDVQGSIIRANEDTGCVMINPPSEIVTDDQLGWILLMNDRGCSFEKKIGNAIDGGFNAVIYYRVETNETEILGLSNNEIVELGIPAYSIGSYDGILLGRNFTHDLGFYIAIDTPKSLYEVTIFIVVWAGVAAIVLVFLFSLLKSAWPTMIQPLYEKYRKSVMKEALQARVNSIPQVKWKKEVHGHLEKCVICIEDFMDGDCLRVLDCSHGFHKICVDTWLLKSNNVCPLCKEEVKITNMISKSYDAEARERSHITLNMPPDVA